MPHENQQKIATPWTPGPWEAYDANEGTDYFPGWEVANDEYHNPSSDDDAPWIAVHLTTGVEADARLIALAPEMAEAILGDRHVQYQRDRIDGADRCHCLQCRVATKLRALSTNAEEANR